MKKVLISVLTVLSFCGVANAQMQALFGYSKYYLPEQGQPYVETCLQFDAWTLHFEEQPTGGYKASVEVTLVVSQFDSVCYFKKYDLGSPVVSDLEHLDFSFLDVQRFALNNGVYNLYITLRDKGADAQPATLNEKIVVSYERSKPTLSGLQLMASVKPTAKENMLSRGGFDMEPYVSDFVPEQVDKLNFYYEIYNIDQNFANDKDPRGTKHAAVLTVAYLEEMETGRRVTADQAVARKNAAPSVPVLGSIDISQLSSGNYNLVCEVRDREDRLLLYSKLPFFRSNPGVKTSDVSDFALTFAGRYTDEGQLSLYLDALYPIASEQEKRVVNELVKRKGLEEKQAFLYHFWVARDKMSPEAAWLRYKERIDYVQEHFSYPRTRGIMTDRGRVYLQYGPPDFVRDEKNFAVMGRTNALESRTTSATEIGNVRANPSNMDEIVGVGQTFYLPYQLWRYNKLPDDDQNRVFLFWDEHSSGYYTLLNSNARGEVQEADWERRLSRQMIPEGQVGEVGRQFNRGY